ncbi:hypothetical protein LTR95_015396 [Oleoguttula sp. CCFEE 5521]
MTPRRKRTDFSSSHFSAEVPSLIARIRETLGSDVSVVLYNYIALNYFNKEEEDQGDTNGDDRRLAARNAQGAALFQYSPNGRGVGRRGWRIFFEHNQFQDTDPRPGLDAARGIPDV